MGTCQDTPRTIFSRSAATLIAVALVIATTSGATTPTAGAQATPSSTAACTQAVAIALPCTLLGKTTEALAAACRRAGVADTQCTLPLAKQVTRAEHDAYLKSAVHRNALFQSGLGDALPLLQAPWLGTHNSFNSVNDSPTISHSDSNQQLNLADQLDVDIRALELDLHYLPRPTAPGGREVIVCHGQGPSALDAGCTNEAAFTQVLPQIATWLNAADHQDEVLLLYLEDKMEDEAGYASAIATLNAVLRRPDGSSLIYRPSVGMQAKNGCSPLPLSLTRAQIRATGARVILVGNCAKGWASDVYDWTGVHVESGSTAAYKPAPLCDSTYGRAVYASKLVRYYEDSTVVATVVDPTTPSVDPDALTPAKVAAMTACGVGLFGFDQLLPNDGRVAASIWSWAGGQPKSAPACTVQGTDARWRTSRCAVARRAACIKGGTTWTLTAKAVPFARAVAACRARKARFAVPRSGLQNGQLHAVAGGPHAVWIAHRTR